MKAFKLIAVAALLIAVNPRVGVHHSGQVYAMSCNAQVAVSAGPNGIGHAYFSHSNPFSGYAMRQAFGC
jgi:hypothetical protein